MVDWPTIGFGSFLLVLSGSMLLMGFRNRRSGEQQERPAHEQQFRASQHRRRTAANILLALVGVTILGSLLVSGTVATLIYWSAVLVIVAGILWLVIADLLSARAYFGDLIQQQQAQRAALEQELAEYRSSHADSDAE